MSEFDIKNDSNVCQIEASISVLKDGVHLITIPLKTRICERWTIGRKKDNDIVVNSMNVSRIHATIQKIQDTSGVKYQIIDGSIEKPSINGIFYQGDRVLWHPLKNGDFIDLPDNYLLEFRCKDIISCNPHDTLS